MRFVIVLLMMCILVAGKTLSEPYNYCYLDGKAYTLRQILTSWERKENKEATEVVTMAVNMKDEVKRAHRGCLDKLTSDFVNKAYAFCIVKTLREVCIEMWNFAKSTPFKGNV